MSAAEALEHPFITQNTGATRSSTAPEPTRDIKNAVCKPFESATAEAIVRSLILYVNASPLIKLILSMVVSLLDVQQVKLLREEFFYLDTMHYGRITLAEFYSGMMQAPSVLCGAVDLYALYGAVAVPAKHHEEGIGYREYLAGAICGRLVVADHYIEEAFCISDIESQSYVTADSLRLKFGDSLSEDALRSIMAAGDRNGSGKLVLTDFFSAWKSFQTSCFVSSIDSNSSGNVTYFSGATTKTSI